MTRPPRVRPRGVRTSPAGLTEEFKQDCVKLHGEVLTGEFAHWCNDWDGLPIDETCDEFTACQDVVDPNADELRASLRQRDGVRTKGGKGR